MDCLLERRETPDQVRLRAAAEVLKHVAKATSGPADIEEAENAVANRVKGKAQARMMGQARASAERS